MGMCQCFLINSAERHKGFFGGVQKKDNQAFNFFRGWPNYDGNSGGVRRYSSQGIVMVMKPSQVADFLCLC